MVTRTLTTEYIQIRSLLKKRYEVDSEEDTVVPLENDVPTRDPPEWLSEVEFIEKKIAELNTALANLEELMTENPSFEGNSTNELEIGHKSRILMVELQKCGLAVKTLGSTFPESLEETSLKQNIHKAMAAQLQQMTSKYRVMQEQYATKIGGRKKPSYMKPKDDPSQDDDSDDNPWKDKLQQQSTIDVSKQQAKLRHQQIQQIHKNMLDLKTLFTELAEIVIVQGTILDRIDQNLAAASEHIKEASSEIDEIDKKSNTTTKCWIALLVIVVIFSVVVIIVLRVRRG